MMDSPDTIKQVNSDIKEYDEKRVRSSNIPLGCIVDNKLGHYWYNYVTRDVLSDVTEEIPPTSSKSKSPLTKEARGGGRGHILQTQHI